MSDGADGGGTSGSGGPAPGDCPCGSGAPYAACCGPAHDGSRPAATALALMRSRYAAFALGEGDYLVRTGSPPPADALSAWGRSVAWLGLVVHGAEAGGVDDASGFVTFTARYLERGREVALHERSRFERRDGRWHYLDGQADVQARAVERNAPCPCGSGRKFKACHA